MHQYKLTAYDGLGSVIINLYVEGETQYSAHMEAKHSGEIMIDSGAYCVEMYYKGELAGFLPGYGEPPPHCWPQEKIDSVKRSVQVFHLSATPQANKLPV